MSFKDGRIGVGKDPIFPLDISGSCRIDGDLILGGRFSDSQGNPIQLGSGSGATSTPDQTSSSLPSWNGGTITTQGLGVFKGKMDATDSSIYISGDNSKPANLTTWGGVENTTLGFYAGEDIVSGNSNVFVGSYAGTNVTNCSENVVIGSNAMSQYNLNYCTFVGYQAGRWAMHDNNMGIGYFSLQYTNKGSNTAIGTCALQGKVSYQGIEKGVGLGYYAGRYQGASIGNIWIGYEAGPQQNTSTSGTGNYNVGIGYRSLWNITSGYYNTCIGYDTARQLNSGGNNVCIGYNCGPNITNHYNTLIGASAGTGMTTASYNTVVGYQAYNCSGLPGSRVGNVFVGYQSGYRPNCDNNVAVGYRSLYNKKAAVCTAIGYQCMGSDSPDSDYAGYNTGVGYNVLRNVEGSSSGQGSFNTVMGHAACQNLTTGYKNVVIGTNAALMNTHLNQSVVIGHSAGYNITNSTGNVIIGIQAGMAYTGGGNNVFIGYYAGTNSTNGQHNTLIGYNAGYAITTGGQNTCYGNHAGYGITTGNNSIAIGNYAMKSGACTGNYNTTIGFYAGYSFTSGYNNVGVGTNANRNVTTGSYNVSIGDYCGRSITSGTHNSFLGPQAGYSCTTGYYNVNIGYNADYYNTTGAYNIALGYHSGKSSSNGDTENYKLYINSHGGYYDENSFMYGYMYMTDNPYLVLNAKLGIGRTDPSYRLDIKCIGGVEAMRIESTSNTSMYAKYDYNQVSSFGDPLYLNYGTSANVILCYHASISTGNVGIGTSSPGYTLEVVGSNTTGTISGTATMHPGGSYFYSNHNNNTSVSAKFSSGLWCAGGNIMISSDERIKENIVDVSDNLALEMVRKIPCRYYEYKDKYSRGTEKTIGFIAQEVKTILPMAVGVEPNIIPNEMRHLRNISWNDTTLYTDLSNCSGIKYRFYVSNDVSGNDELRKEVIGNSDNSFTFDTSYNNVFCYGKEVDDFHTLDKAKLFALNFSATQELDRKVTALETVGNQDHNVKILDLYKENQELKARLAKIEAFLGI